MWDSDPDSPKPSWRGGLCERTGPSLYGGSHRNEQEDFSQKEKDPLGHFGEFPCSNSASLLSTPPPIRDYVHLILEGAETTGTTRAGCPSTEECVYLISEGAEAIGTTRGRVPSDWECAQRPGSVRSDQGVSAPHLRGN